MAKPSKNSTNKPTNPGPGSEPPDSQLRLWKTHREESVFFQREAQVNFWTVLGGLAMAALLTQLSPLLIEMQNSRWYLILYLVSSVLIVGNSWVQTAWGSLVMKWPISIISTVIVLFQMLTQSIQCLQITHPAGWYAATAGLILFSLLIQSYFARSGAWAVYSPGAVKRFKIVNGVYGLLLIICLVAAWHLYSNPNRTVELVWGCLALILSVAALYIQHIGMQAEKKILGIP